MLRLFRQQHLYLCSNCCAGVLRHHRKRCFIPPALLFVISILVTGCETTKKTSGGDTSGSHKSGGVSTTYSGSGPIRVTTTIGMISDIVENVGGERVAVQGLMGPGVDPHLYKTTPGDLSKLQNTDIAFHNGMHLEGKMGEVLERIGNKKPVVAVTKDIDPKLLLRPAAFKGNPDPHVWFDVELWMKAVETVRDSLVQFDPPHKAEYEKNATTYLAKMREMDAYVTKAVATVPKERRVLITAHDAFGYFGKAYDIEVVGLQGISTASEYSLQDVRNLVDIISKRGIKAVFIESSVPRRSIDAVVQGCRARGHNVKIGGTLYSDAMGPEGTPEGTYLGMVRKNVDTIVEALK